MNEVPPKPTVILPRLGDDTPADRPQRKWEEFFWPNPIPPRPEAFDLLLIEVDRHRAYVKAHGKESIAGEQAWRAMISCKVKIGGLVTIATKTEASATSPEEDERVARQIEANRVAEERRVAAAKERARLRQEKAELEQAGREGLEDVVESEEDRQADSLARAVGEELRKPKGQVVPMRREERARTGREERVEDREEAPFPWKTRLRWADDLKADVVPDLMFRVGALWPKVWLSLLNGDGGAGKSTLLTQLFSAMAEGRPIFGRATLPCRTMLISSEEDDDLASRRLNRMPDVGRFPIFNLLDWPEACELCVSLRDGTVMAGAFLAVLREMIGDLRPELVGLDHVGDLFLINENSKAEVNAALQLLRPLHAEFGVDFVLAQHISKAGMASGRRDAGTPQWHNKARWRAALYPPGLTDTASEDEALAALAERFRVLEVMKDNYGGKAGEKISLLREAWHFVPEDGVVGKAVAKSLAEGLLAYAQSMSRAAAGTAWPAAPAASGSLVVLFRQSLGKTAPKMADVVGAQEELVRSGALERFSQPNARRVAVDYLRVR